MRFVNNPDPWTGSVERNLSIVDLLASGTITAPVAAALWWALEHGASLLTAGGPSGAGKSTLANALLPFLPTSAPIYVVSGRGDPLELPAGGPAYLLVSELSAHGRPHYLSGPTARRAFALLQDGTRLVGTMHADSVAEAIASLRDEFELPAAAVARVTLIAITRITRGEFRRHPYPQASSDIERRIVEVGLLSPAAEGVGVERLTSWQPESGHLDLASGAADALAGWADLPTTEVEAAIRDRATVLLGLTREGLRAPDEVAAAVRGLRKPLTS